MATPTCETIETRCNEKSSSWHLDFVFMICIWVTIHFTSHLQDFIAFLLIIFIWCFLFSWDSCASCSYATTLHSSWQHCVHQEITTQQILSILTFTHALQSYLTFEAINVSNQKPCILCTHFTQAYCTLALSSTIINC